MSGTLLFDGTDLASLCIVEDLSDFWSTSDLRGDLPVYAGTPGAVAISRPVAFKTCSGQLTIADDTLADIEDGVAAVKAVLDLGRSQTLTRRKITGSGNLDATQTAIVRSAEERWLGDAACTLLIGVDLLDGVWYGSAVPIGSAAGSQSIAGDAPTHRMTITLASGGPTRTITNTTTGHAFTYSATVPASGVLVDVEARTAVDLSTSPATDVSQYLSWTKFYPMRFQPGTNVLTVSAGSASVSYQPAYQ